MIDRVIPRFLGAAFVILNATFCIAQADTLQIPLSGIGAVQSSDQLDINPPVFNSGDVELGQQNTQTIDITHLGDVNQLPIDIYSVNIEGNDAFEFAVSNAVSYTHLTLPTILLV